VRFLADENFPSAVVELLRTRGHDVTWMVTEAPGSPDTDVLARAQEEERTVITFDKDFGALAFRPLLPAASGVVLFRIPKPATASAAVRTIAALESRDDWTGFFAVVEMHRVRVVPLPSSERRS
jgi:hypothetical protein